ncbi:MAG: hypothetical protein ABIO37_00835 [Caulobacteraceae bacterium]
MIKFVLPTAIALAVLAGGPVLAADAPQGAAAETTGPIANERSDDVAAQISDYIKESAQADAAEGASTIPQPARDRAIHGEAGVAVGSGGYRSAYGVAVMPLGKNGTATVGVSDTRYGKSRWGGRGGDSRSLYLALDLSGAAKDPTDRCERERAAQPVWVSPARRAEAISAACAPAVDR